LGYVLAKIGNFFLFLRKKSNHSKKRGENVFCHEDTKAQRIINQCFSVLMPLWLYQICHAF